MTLTPAPHGTCEALLSLALPSSSRETVPPPPPHLGFLPEDKDPKSSLRSMLSTAVLQTQKTKTKLGSDLNNSLNLHTARKGVERLLTPSVQSDALLDLDPETPVDSSARLILLSLSLLLPNLRLSLARSASLSSLRRAAFLSPPPPPPSGYERELVAQLLLLDTFRDQQQAIARLGSGEDSGKLATIRPSIRPTQSNVRTAEAIISGQVWKASAPPSGCPGARCWLLRGQMGKCEMEVDASAEEVLARLWHEGDDGCDGEELRGGKRLSHVGPRPPPLPRARRETKGRRVLLRAFSDGKRFVASRLCWNRLENGDYALVYEPVRVEGKAREAAAEKLASKVKRVRRKLDGLVNPESGITTRGAKLEGALRKELERALEEEAVLDDCHATEEAFMREFFARVVGQTQIEASGFFRLRRLGVGVCQATMVQSWDKRGEPKFKPLTELAITVQRNPATVDKEMAEESKEPPFLRELDAEQTEIMESCMALGRNTDDHEWRTKKSPSLQRLKYASKAPTKEQGPLGIINRSTTRIDCSPKDALYYCQGYCSRERMRSMKSGTMRQIVSELAPNDIIYGDVSPSGLALFKSRETVIRCIFASDPGGGYALAVVSAPPTTKPVWYKRGRAVRVDVKTYVDIKPVEGVDDQCIVDVFSQVDYKSYVLTHLMDTCGKHVLSNAIKMQQHYERNAQIDSVPQAAMVAVMRDERQKYTAAEETVLADAKSDLEGMDERFKGMESPDHFVSMSTLVETKDHRLRARVVVDATVAECVAWECLKDSRFVQEQLSKLGVGDSDWSLMRANTHSAFLRANFISHTASRGFRHKHKIMVHQVWKYEDEETKTVAYVAYRDAAGAADGLLNRHVSTSALFKFEELHSACNIPQTQVTMLAAIGTFVARRQSVKSMMYLSTMRRSFDRSLEFDTYLHQEQVQLLQNKKMMIPAESVGTIATLKSSGTLSDKTRIVKYDSEENSAIDKALEYLKLFSDENPDARNLKLSDVLQRCNKVVPSPDGEGGDWYMRDKESHGVGDIVVAHARDSVTRDIWKKTLDTNTYILIERPEHHPERPISDKVTRQNLCIVFEVKKITSGVSKVTVLARVQGEGPPSRSSWRAAVEETLAIPLRAQLFFTSFRKTYSVMDGEYLGELLVREIMEEHHAGKDRVAVRVKELIRRNNGLRRVAAENAWLAPMLTEIAKNRLRPPKDVNAFTINSLTADNGRYLGGNLAAALAVNLTAQNGVDEWIVRHPVLKKIDEEFVWFRPLVACAGKRLLANVSWGSKARLYTTSFVSLLDLFFDVYMVLEYFGYFGSEETLTYGYATLGFALLTVCLQLAIVLVQNRGGSTKHIVQECVVTIFGLKLAISAFNLTSEEPPEVHHVVDRHAEFISLKMIDLFAKAIPGTILQSIALVQMLEEGGAGNVTIIMATGSILVSAAAAGFGTALLTYDLDVDPIRRRVAPDFYGAIPDSNTGRLGMFVAMVANSTVLLLLRSFSAALLWKNDRVYLFGWVMGDIGLFFLVKVLQRDFMYWLNPGLGRKGHFVISIVLRFIFKFVTDSTGLFNTRHPEEVGGWGWVMSVMSALTCCVFAVFTHTSSGAESDKGWVLGVAGALGLLWVGSFASMVLLMKPEYRKTMYSTTSGREYAMGQFIKADNDEKRARIFPTSNALWSPIHEEVEGWVKENYWRWEAEKPEWFTDHVKSTIRDDLLPEEEKYHPLIGVVGVNRRKNDAELDVLRKRAKFAKTSALKKGAIQPVVAAAESGAGKQ
ncbi:hypothetical protein TeGR_g7043 [Tetraparma gracilis]|uniref:Uncharacterized protein n=1 Tax=Tetraparma gracilis TaxID=2962635 RepID=A0ABQ6N490_9STRA|nr:hypothetical protein TeGR_g7043 [Tetraparma gracilis]